MDLKETEILGEDAGDHWYYISKAKFIKKILDTRSYSLILDIGSGSGFFSKFLLAETGIKKAICVDTGYINEFKEQTAGKIIHYKKSIESTDADLILLMDVLEHVDDDIGLLKEYIDKVPSGSTFLITVPAFKFLWSDHDVFLEHKRRYILAQLESVVLASGLKIDKSGYIFGFIFPIAVLTRLLNKFLPSRQQKSQLTKHSKFINTILKIFCQFERPFIRNNRLLGLSVFCLAIKDN